MVGNAGKVSMGLIRAILGVVFAIACIAFAKTMDLNGFITAAIVIVGVAVMIISIASLGAKSSTDESAKQ
jgi:peptidoglycan/LPS O-acetylase OafA/YrhL